MNMTTLLKNIKRAVFGKLGGNVRELRRKKELNQHDFWEKIGMTQSAGSRYESGRNIPKPVAELVRLTHEENIDTTQLVDEQAEVVRLLQAGQLSASVILQRQQEFEAKAEELEKKAEQYRRGETPEK